MARISLERTFPWTNFPARADGESCGSWHAKCHIEHMFRDHHHADRLRGTHQTPCRTGSTPCTRQPSARGNLARSEQRGAGVRLRLSVFQRQDLNLESGGAKKSSAGYRMAHPSAPSPSTCPRAAPWHSGGTPAARISELSRSLGCRLHRSAPQAELRTLRAHTDEIHCIKNSSP